MGVDGLEIVETKSVAWRWHELTVEFVDWGDRDCPETLLMHSIASHLVLEFVGAFLVEQDRSIGPHAL